MNRVPHQRSTGGFTFVEVLAAMVFLLILMPVLVEALSLSNRAAVVSERSQLAAQLGENKLNELIMEQNWSTAGLQGDFGEDWSGYSWKLSSSRWGQGEMTELIMEVSFPVQGKSHQVHLSTLVGNPTS